MFPGCFGARGQLGYDEDNQGVQEQDIVFWYVAHLPHMAALGPDEMARRRPYPAHSTVVLACSLRAVICPRRTQIDPRGSNICSEIFCWSAVQTPTVHRLLGPDRHYDRVRPTRLQKPKDFTPLKLNVRHQNLPSAGRGHVNGTCPIGVLEFSMRGCERLSQGRRPDRNSPTMGSVLKLAGTADKESLQFFC